MIGVVSLLCALYFFLDTANFVRIAKPIRGRVVRLATRQSTGFRWPASTYAPVVTFTTPEAQVVTFTATVSSNPSRYEVGDTVPVLYDPLNPVRARLGTLLDLWFWSLLLVVFGAIFLATSYVQRFGKQARSSASLPT